MIGMYCRASHPGAPSGGPDSCADQTGAADMTGAVAGAPAASTAPSAVPATESADPGLCPACAALAEYSRRRVEQCRFGEDKPTCSHCPVHCFRPETRGQIKTVMRYSGPRMTLRHPYLAVRHLLDKRQPVI